LELVATRLGVTEVNLCGSCTGIWFDRGEIYLFASNPKGLNQYLAAHTIPARNPPNTVSAPPANAQQEPHCPRCQNPLDPFEVKIAPSTETNNHPELRIDACRHCSGIWVDRPDFSALAKLDPGYKKFVSTDSAKVRVAAQPGRVRVDRFLPGISGK
jgi:Zn-finger nucleic acid-binding protein